MKFLTRLFSSSTTAVILVAVAALVAVGCSTPQTVGTQISDADIETEARFADDPVNVDVDVGVATLTGRVESEEAKRRAEEIAEGTDGVLGVENRLEVGEMRSS